MEESGSILSLRCAPFSQIGESAPKGSTQAPCNRIEMANARRLTRRSRVRWAASPSTRHPLSDSKTLFGDCFGNFCRLGRHHTPPHFFLRVSTALQSHRTGVQKFCGADFLGGCSRSPGDRRRARRDVRLRASLTALDTGRWHKFPVESRKIGLCSREIASWLQNR